MPQKRLCPHHYLLPQPNAWIIKRLRQYSPVLFSNLYPCKRGKKKGTAPLPVPAALAQLTGIWYDLLCTAEWNSIALSCWNNPGPCRKNSPLELTSCQPRWTKSGSLLLDMVPGIKFSKALWGRSWPSGQENLDPHRFKFSFAEYMGPGSLSARFREQRRRGRARYNAVSSFLWRNRWKNR